MKRFVRSHSFASLITSNNSLLEMIDIPWTVTLQHSPARQARNPRDPFPLRWGKRGNMFYAARSRSHAALPTSHLILTDAATATSTLSCTSSRGQQAPRCLQDFQRYTLELYMQRLAQVIRLHGSRLRHAVLLHLAGKWSVYAPRPEASTSVAGRLPHKGLENTTVADLLKEAKGERAAGQVLWCTTVDTVYDAVKHMTEQNVGALVVVKPGEERTIAGIVTERDYLRKIIVQGRSSTSTSVGEIMTDENKLVTVSSDTSILQAMELMTEKRIRHIPVIDKKVVGVISIVDVVRAVVDQQHQEVQRLNDFIKGKYY